MKIVTKVYYFLCMFILIPTLGWSQGTLFGTVKDAQSDYGLSGATIVLLHEDSSRSQQGVVTDENGRFIFNDLPLGRHSFEISLLGYHTKRVQNILIVAGKSTPLHVLIEERFEKLNEIVLKAQSERPPSGLVNTMQVHSAQRFEVEAVERFSGGRRDVARMARNYAGVLNTDDSRNDILVRGNSPTGVLWRLEGVPIPNPNHFAVAGTTGGPVGAVNLNMLGSSNFLRGAFPAEYGNVSAGVFDLQFRNGNATEREITAQLHATGGVELQVEGPINPNKYSSYNVSYRYALTSLEIIPIGTNAVPNYQDLSFKVNFGKVAGGQLHTFGLMGKSDINFLSDALDEDDLFANPNEDLYNQSELAILGLQYKRYLNQNTYLKSTVAYNYTLSKVRQDNYTLLNNTRTKFNALNIEDRLQTLHFSTLINKKLNAAWDFQTGFLVSSSSARSSIQNRDNLSQDQIMDNDGDGLPDFLLVSDFNGGMTQVQLYGQTRYRWSEKVRLTAGVHSQYFSLNRQATFEPRGGIVWQWHPQHNLGFSVGLQTQTQQLPVLFYSTYSPTNGTYSQDNLTLKNTQSTHYIVSYGWQLGPHWSLKAEAYWQQISRVPIERFPSTYSVMNEGANFRFSRKGNLVNRGQGKNQGVELSLERLFHRNLYFLFSGALFDAKYTPSDGIERNTAFNNTYVYNVLGGKEFELSRTQKGITHFFFNTKITGAGGGYYTPINLDATIANNGNEIYLDDQAFSERYPDYFRWDAKIGVRREGKQKNISQEWSIDFLNLTNRENLFVKRYNEVNQSVNNVDQLGFFLDILYKIQF